MEALETTLSMDTHITDDRTHLKDHWMVNSLQLQFYQDPIFQCISAGEVHEVNHFVDLHTLLLLAVMLDEPTTTHAPHAWEFSPLSQNLLLPFPTIMVTPVCY